MKYCYFGKKKKINFGGLRGIFFFPLTTISCSPQRTHPPKTKLHFSLILIELNGYQ